jgi:glycosyltransferase involved in cell wall biosynthesis
LPGQAIAALALAKRMRGRKVRHIHAHMAHSPATIAMYTARQLGVRFSFTGHAADLFRDRAMLRCKLKRSDFTACISEWHRSFYQTLVPRPSHDYPVIRCGVDPNEFAPEPGRECNDPLLILSVGRLVRKKGFDVLLRALHQLKRQGLSFQTIIAGGGERQAELVSLADSLGLSQTVAFSGACSNRHVNKMMSRADLFVLPCRVAESGDRDGIPVVLMEAMASEICVVSGDLPAIRELVKKGETGFLVPPGDVQGLAEMLRKLFNDPALRGRAARAGRQWVHKEFSLKTNVERLMAALDHVEQDGGKPDE